MAWFHRLGNVLRPGRHAREIARELEFHVAERRDALIAAGLAPEAAAREAERRFGNRLLQTERTRDAGVVVWLESLVADLRYALRGFRRNPGFAAVAILSLALGIGANTALFTLTNAVLLRSLPVRDPGALVRLTKDEADDDAFTNPLWEAIRDRQNVFDGVFAYAGMRFNLAEAGPVRRTNGALVSGGFFSTLGVRAESGRLLGPGDDVRGCSPVVVASDGFARRELGGAAAAPGKAVSIGGHAFTVVGVADSGFRGIQVGTPVDLYAPLCSVTLLRDDPEALDRRSTWYLKLIGRRAPGVSLAQVEAGVAAIAPDVFAAALPPRWSPDDQRQFLETKLHALPAPRGISDLRDRYGRALVILLAIVFLVLLVACANIANLLLARAAARQGESALRRALGAGRARLVRQSLTEALLLSLIGAAAGVLFARWASALLVRFVTTSEFRPWLDLTPDLRVLGFAFLVAVGTGLLFGLAPARFASRAVPATAARGGARGLAGGDTHRAGKALVVFQVALSLVLVAAAALLVGSFRRLAAVDPGFRAAGVLVIDADFRATGLENDALDLAKRDLLERLRALPEVDGASASQLTPIGRMRWDEVLVVPGFTAATPNDAVANFNTVSDGYFANLGLPLVAGRDLSPSDLPGAPRVAVVDQAFVRHFLGDGSPLGRTFAIRDRSETSDPIEIVGVVGDAKYGSLDETPSPTVYRPAGQQPGFGTQFAFEVRSGAPPADVVAAVKRTIAELQPEMSFELTTLSDQLARTLARPRLLATLSGFFGALALLLAVIGLYGTLSYTVTRRRGEIGLRMALGAAGGSVLRLIVSEAGRLILLGLGLGALLTHAATRWIATFLYGVAPNDPGTLGVSVVLLALTALGAALLPALRATRVEPSEVLRE